MKKNYNLMTLVTELENIVGNCYHNQQKRGGFYFRYPVNYEGGYQTKKRLPDIKPDNLNTIKYTTGANSLYIGIAIYKMLNFLEERYDLDFDDLEEGYQQLEDIRRQYDGMYDDE